MKMAVKHSTHRKRPLGANMFKRPRHLVEVEGTGAIPI